MKEKEIREELEVPEGVEVKIENRILTAKGKKGECSRKIVDPRVNVELVEGNVIVSVKNATKRDKRKMVTYAAHILNLMRGAAEGHIYKLKICSGHFPMTVILSGKEFTVNNFLGEKHPRKVILKEGADVKIEGDIITVESCNKEIAGQTAADIEKLTRITNRDLRIFQDGVYITEKDGKPIR